MNPIINQCPICQEQMIVTRLYCPSCATAIEGRFSLGTLARLSEDQLDFVLTFIRCEGKLNRVQDELSISYPTVRARLEGVMEALGFSIDRSDETIMLTEEERRAILADLAAGRISSQQANQMLLGQLPAEPDQED